MKISLVCCDDTPAKLTRIVEVEIDSALLDERVLETVEQELPAGLARDLHNAAHHPEHGAVTYLQHVHEGGFSVFVGAAGSLQETFFGPGSRVAFIDDEGPGHGSKVGPAGVRRTMRVLKGHLPIPK